MWRPIFRNFQSKFGYFIKQNGNNLVNFKNRTYFCTKNGKETHQIFSQTFYDSKVQQKIQQKPQNSIAPLPEQGYAYGHFFPKDWNQQKIMKILDPTKTNIQKLSIIKNKVGEHSGKILIKFVNQKTMKKYINKYHQDYIMAEQQMHRVAILPFDLKTQQKKHKIRENRNYSNGVRISNMDFDITQFQMNKLAEDYGKVSHIDMNMRLKGINRGFCTVYFQQSKSAFDFMNFIDGFMYRQRKLKAHLMGKPETKQKQEFLEVPTYTFKCNLQLALKLREKQIEKVKIQ